MSVLKHIESGDWKAILALPSSKYDYADPTDKTQADYIGQIFLNKSNNNVFICTDIQNQVYTWVCVCQNPAKKEDIRHLTLNDLNTGSNKQYELKVQTGDYGTEGYITFVVQN